MTNTSPEAAQAKAARLAGAMYLITMATAIFGQSFVRGSLLVRGDATQTAQNIIGSERFFRVGIATDIVTLLLLMTSAITVIVFPAVGPFVLATMIPMFIYEVGLGFWLLLKGARIEPSPGSAA